MSVFLEFMVEIFVDLLLLHRRVTWPIKILIIASLVALVWFFQ